MNARIATPLDVLGITETVTSAFFNDPLWSWAFPVPEVRRDQHRVWWRFLIESSLRYPWTWVTEHCEAMTLWIPPGGTELAHDEEDRVEPLLQDILGEGAARVLRIAELLDEAHPREVPHYYLSLVATHDDHRGRGLGMGLLGQNLRVIDSERMPAYLESSNVANDSRYERLGFQRHGCIDFTILGGPLVTTMWRPGA